MGWRIALTDEAERDLAEIVSFIARISPEAAERIGLELIWTISSLAEMPTRGVPMRRRLDLRKIIHRHYLIIYRVEEAASLVHIVRVWDNRQDPQKLRLP